MISDRNSHIILIDRLRTFSLQLKYHNAVSELYYLAFKAGFHADQPRVPRGSPDGGQWTLVGKRPWPLRLRQPVDLVKEEARGGHAIEKHVGKSEQALRERLVNGFAHVGNIQAGDRAVGTFNNLQEATYYVNQTIERNLETVDLVRSGKARQAIIFAYFSKPVGFQIFISKIGYDWTLEPYFQTEKRLVNGLLVKIVRDSGNNNGFRVVTAYPITEDAQGND